MVGNPWQPRSSKTVYTGVRLRIITRSAPTKFRVIEGKKKKELNLKLEGEIEGDEIKGQAQDDKGAYQITFRCTRLADLP
jgi:hypothetical protein